MHVHIPLLRSDDFDVAGRGTNEVCLVCRGRELMKCVWFAEGDRDGFKAPFHSRRSVPCWLKVPVRVVVAFLAYFKYLFRLFI